MQKYRRPAVGLKENLKMKKINLKNILKILFSANKTFSKCCLYFEVKNTLVKFSLKNFLDHSLAQSGFIHFGIVSFKMYVSQQDLHTSNPQYIQEILERVLLL